MTSAYRFSPKLAWRVWQREATLYKRIWPSTILSGLLDPLIYLLAMGFGLGAYVTRTMGGVPYLEFIAPGLVASSIMMAATFEIAWNSFVRIHIERAYDAMMSTPAALEDVVVGEIWWATTRSVIYASVMMLVLLALGLVSSWWALLVPLVALLGGLAFGFIGLSYTSLVKHMDHLTFYFTLFVTPMFLFSGIFFPISGLPRAAQIVAGFTPLYHLVEVTRGLILGTVGAHTLWSVAALVGFVIVFFPVPILVLRRKLVI